MKYFILLCIFISSLAQGQQDHYYLHRLECFDEGKSLIIDVKGKTQTEYEDVGELFIAHNNVLVQKMTNIHVIHLGFVLNETDIPAVNSLSINLGRSGSIEILKLEGEKLYKVNSSAMNFLISNKDLECTHTLFKPRPMSGGN